MHRRVPKQPSRSLNWPGLLLRLLPLFSLVAAGARADIVKTSDPSMMAPVAASVADQFGVGAWIWTTNEADKQTCRLWRSFTLPGDVPLARAILRITGDNGYRIFLDGREIGRGGDWKYLSEYDLTSLMTPGPHIMAVEAFNDARDAGVIMGLRMQFADGQAMDIFSDPSWRIVPTDEWHWQTRKHPGQSWFPARIVGFAGQQPWWHEPYIIYAPPSLPVILRFWQQNWFLGMLLTLCTAVVAICLRQATQLAVQTRAQKLLERERVRIARDIHDDLGARLTQLVLLSEVARSQLPDSEARAQIDQVCDKARDLSHAMDEVIWAVNSRRDTLRDFASYVCKYGQLFLAPTPIRCRLDVEPEIPAIAFDLPVRRNVFLAAKEALNNAAKHSEARELFLRIHRVGNDLMVAVEDDGKGLDVSQPNLERNGMTNMSQRMHEAGGHCRVISQPGHGCRVELTVPLVRKTSFFKRFKWREKPVPDESTRFGEPGTIPTHAPDSARS